MLLTGVCLLALGGRNPTIALFVLNTALVGTILLFIIYYMLPSYTPSWSVWLVLYFTYCNGAVLGFGATMSPRIGVTVCGSIFGFFVGLIIDLTVIRRFVDSASYANTLTILFFVVLFALISIPLYDYAVIVSSCTFGSYIAWRVSLLLS
jgi:Domain of unknown function (DUF4203)